MTTTLPPTFTALSDADLIAQVASLAANERRATVQLIAALMELDVRRLYLAQGCSSLFTYCVQILHLSEHAAYGRIEASRAARRFPAILDHLADGTLTLTAVGMLRRTSDAGQYRTVLDAARHKTKREVQQLVARLRPLPPVAQSIRKLPACVPPSAQPPLLTAPGAPATPTAPTSSNAPPSEARALEPPKSPMPRPAVVAPLAPEIYKVQVTLGREAVEKLRRAQDLLRHAIPNGDVATILDRALALLVAEVERTKLAGDPGATCQSRAGTSFAHIPAHVRRAVWTRDEGRCTFRGAAGRCTERGFLEFHHLEPYARGGRATVDMIALRCRPHNLFEAELDFGPCVPRRARIGAPDPSTPPAESAMS